MALSRIEMEQRRMRAAEKFSEGAYPAEVARLLGVSRTNASKWHLTFQEKGVEGLKKRKTNGRPHRISMEKIFDLYNKGPRAYGYDHDNWSVVSFKESIRKVLRTTYHRDHVYRILKKCRGTRD